MTLRYLLDTNILSEPLRPNPNPVISQKLLQHQTEVATASVVFHEISYGSYRLPIQSYKRQVIQAFFDRQVQQVMPILPYDLAVAAWFAIERARLVTQGQTPTYADGQIAAIAHVNNLVLVTNNVSDFANFQALHLENWFSS